MSRGQHKAVGFQLSKLLNCQVKVVSRVDVPNTIIIVLDLQSLPAGVERSIQKHLPAWLKFSVHTYESLRAIANDPNSNTADLLTAAHVLPRSVHLNAVYDLIALENPLVAQHLQGMLEDK